MKDSRVRNSQRTKRAKRSHSVERPRRRRQREESPVCDGGSGGRGGELARGAVCLGNGEGDDGVRKLQSEIRRTVIAA